MHLWEKIKNLFHKNRTLERDRAPETRGKTRAIRHASPGPPYSDPSFVEMMRKHCDRTRYHVIRVY